MMLKTRIAVALGYLLIQLLVVLAASLFPFAADSVLKQHVSVLAVVLSSFALLLWLLQQQKKYAQDLQVQSDKLQIALGAGGESFWEWQLLDNSKAINFSADYCRMLGYKPGEFAVNQEQWQSFLHPDERERIYRKVMRHIDAGKTDPYENTYRILHNDGSYRWIHSRGRLVLDEAGQLVSFMGIATDVSAYRADHDRLQQAQVVFETTHEGVLISDHDNRIIFVNPAFSQITGYTQEEVLGKNPGMFQSGRHPREFYQQMWQSLNEHGRWSGEIWNRRKNGEILPQLQSIRLLRDENGLVTYNVAVFSDISLLHRSQSELSFLAHYDPLTNLSNKLLLHQQINLSLQQAKRNKTNSCLFVVDLDYFKNINESLGHASGDELLKAVAERLSLYPAASKTLSRFGGDEFAFVLDNIRGAADAAGHAQRVIDIFNQPFNLNDNEIFITVSIGICLFPLSGDSAEEVFRNADTALSKAKSMGRTTFAFYTSELTEQAYQRLRTVSELRLALDGEQLRIYFQPVYCFVREKIIGCEALVRWQHPERGLVPPFEFIPVAEESGLIASIDLWMLDAGCKQFKLWLEQGLQLDFISLNISSKLFGHSDLASQVAEILQRHQLKPGFVELEITESSLMQDQEQADFLLSELRCLGVRLALDDFGIGYSSLSRLRSLPVDKLKIDQSFIRNLLDDSQDVSIVQSIITLGLNLHLLVQAEGIESAAIADFLRDNNCDLGQGYHFGKPMPAENFYRMLS